MQDDHKNCANTEITTRLRRFLTTRLGIKKLDDSDDIFEVGGATSLIAMELVLFSESEFGIQFHDQDLNRDNFRSIGALAELIRKKA